MPKPENYPPFAAHFDANQVPTQMGVVGTLGTADTGGTAQPLPVAVDPATGAQHVNVINGTVTTSLALNTGTITTIAAGTQNTLGTVGNLNNGSVNVLTGTINVGTFVHPSGTITTGSITDVAKLYTGTINVGTVVNNGGTVQNLNYGTIQIDPKPTPVKTVITNYGTTGTTGAAVFGTLVAAIGAGTFAYIAGCSIVGVSGTAEASIIIGTFTQAAPAGGTNMVARVNAVPGGGIARTFNPMFVSGTNGTICYWLSGAGTVYFDVFYYAAT